MAFFLLFLGGHGMVAQIFYIREAMAAHGGPEWVIGFVFALWFLLGAAGAWQGRWMAGRWEGPSLRWRLTAFAVVLAVWIPVGGEILARGRAVWGGSAYEPLGPGHLFLLIGTALLPTAFFQGMAFPVAARIHREEVAGTLGVLCGAEALGATAGGLWMTWEALSGRGGPMGSVWLAVALAFAAVAVAIPRKGFSTGLALMATALGLSVVLLPSGWRASLEKRWEEIRWKAGAGRPGELIERLDTPYQRLILARLGQQQVVYGNGQALFLFPDPAGEEPLAFSILARHPRAREILVIGAVSPDFRRVLLSACPDARITEVEADVGLFKLIVPEQLLETTESSRYHFVNKDPVSFVLHQPSGFFDLIVLRVPEPSTLGLTRFYTVEFYDTLRKLLRPTGVLWTSVDAAELLGVGVEILPAAVGMSLRKVFHKVEVTYGPRIGFFAGREEADIPMEPQKLVEVARRAGWQTPWFDPTFFETDEASDPYKRARVKTQLEQCPVGPLWRDRPVGHLLAMIRWSRQQQSSWGIRLTTGVLQPSVGSARVWAVFLVVFFAAMAAGMGWKGRRGFIPGSRMAIRLMVGTAGLSAISLELFWMFLAQSRRGYLYERLALLVAFFMAGHTGGAWLSSRLERGSFRAIRAIVVGVGALMVLFWVFLVWATDSDWGDRPIFDGVLVAMMFAAGTAGGLLIPIANRLFRETGVSFSGAAGEIQTADLLGAVVGALLPTFVLLPRFGMASSGALMAVLVGCATLLFVMATAWRQAE